MLKNFVYETSSAPGTATTINLAGTVTGRLAWSSFASGSAVYYIMTDGTQSEWGIGVYTSGSPNTLTRTTVISNSSGTTSRLNFTGTTRVYNDMPGERMAYADSNGDVKAIRHFVAAQHVYAGTYGTTGVGADLDPGGTVRVGASAAAINFAFVGFYNNAGVVGSINFNSSGGVSYNVTSDYRIKMTFGPTTADWLLQVPVYDGAYRIDPDTHRPLILAHELQPLAPWAVMGEKNATDENGTPILQQVDYPALVPALIAQIKALASRIATLEAKTT